MAEFEGLLLNIPHASRDIPDAERSFLLPYDARLQQELLCITDAWTDRLVDDVQGGRVSRLVLDVERFPDDRHEPMAERAMGAVYTRLSTGEALRRIDPVHRDELMRRWYYARPTSSSSSKRQQPSPVWFDGGKSIDHRWIEPITC